MFLVCTVPCTLFLYPLFLWRLNGFYFSIFLCLLPVSHLMSVCLSVCFSLSLSPSLSVSLTHAHTRMHTLHRQTYTHTGFWTLQLSCILVKRPNNPRLSAAASFPLGDQHYSSNQMFLLHLSAHCFGDRTLKYLLL